MDGAESFLLLLLAHLIADFVLQPDWMVERKARPGILLLHAGIVVATAALILGTLNPGLLAILLVTHAAIDWAKQHRLPPARWSEHARFILDQQAHILVLIGLAMLFPASARDGWLRLVEPDGRVLLLSIATVGSGLILAVGVGGIVVAMLTRRMLDEIQHEQAAGRILTDPAQTPPDPGAPVHGLRGGGRVIGWLERTLVVLLLLMNEPAGIGFLVAAKSILRYGDITSSHQRRITEYVIIGTLLSITWAIVVGAATRWALGLWSV